MSEARLAAALTDEYGCVVRRIQRFASGEESLAYVVDDGRRRYLAKLHDPASAQYLPSTVALTEWLAARIRLAVIVAPARTRRGSSHAAFDTRPITLQPFFEGRPLHVADAASVRRVGAAVDEVHTMAFEADERWLQFYEWRWRLDGVAFFGSRALSTPHPEAKDVEMLRRFLTMATSRPGLNAAE
jgi:hypothetical protein